MLRRKDKSILQHAPTRQIVLGAFLFFAFVTLATFFDVSAYLDRAASSKRSSRSPSFIEPIGPATPAASSIPAETSPLMRPTLLPSAMPPSVSTIVSSQSPTRSPRGSSATLARGGVRGMPLRVPRATPRELRPIDERMSTISTNHSNGVSGLSGTGHVC